MTLLFGTDGIRSRINEGLMTPENILKLSMAIGNLLLREYRILREKNPTKRKKITVIIGRDTRISGTLIEMCLVAGFQSIGINVVTLGIIPTAGIGIIVRFLNADLGIMISASHNPFFDNGLKIFNYFGEKINSLDEIAIESYMMNISLSPPPLSSPNNLGLFKNLRSASNYYINFILKTIPNKFNLKGLKIALDCSNGSLYKIAPYVFSNLLEAQVILIGAKPNGFNINNNCGFSNIKLAQKSVIDNQADFGIVFDGDGDRVYLINKLGYILNGDQLLAIFVKYWHQNGLLKNKIAVSTNMSNISLQKYLNSYNISLVKTQVGDKYVSEAMKKYNANIGAEPSGHIILSDFNSNSDALLTSLQILLICLENSFNLEPLFSPCHQILRNIRIESSKKIDLEKIFDINTKLKESLGDNGDIIIRKSGTESLIRIMVQGENENLVNEILNNAIYMINKEILSL